MTDIEAIFSAGRLHGLQEAARLIQGHQIGYGVDGPVLVARYDGNSDGLPYVKAISALAGSAANDLVFWRVAARSMLDAWEAYSLAEPSSDRENVHHLLLAAAFAAAAAEGIFDPDAVPRVIVRTFLRALIDPADPALDYLRACNQSAPDQGGRDG